MCVCVREREREGHVQSVELLYTVHPLIHERERVMYECCYALALYIIHLLIHACIYECVREREREGVFELQAC